MRGGVIEPVVDLDGLVPDGLALDAEGGLLVGCFQPNAIVRLRLADRVVEPWLDDPSGQRLLTPTNIAFYGEQLDRLAIASVCGWTITSIESPWRGAPLPLPLGP